MKRMLLAFALIMLLIGSAAPVFGAGVCSGGPRNGQLCSYNFECGKWCNGGPRNQQVCSYDFECSKTCAGGPSAGQVCSYNFECPGSYCRSWWCQSFYCSGGSGFAALGETEEATPSLKEFLASLASE